jgi:hypothetical protein
MSYCPNCNELVREINRLRKRLRDAEERATDATNLAFELAETSDRMKLQLILAGALTKPKESKAEQALERTLDDSLAEARTNATLTLQLALSGKLQDRRDADGECTRCGLTHAGLCEDEKGATR